MTSLKRPAEAVVPLRRAVELQPGFVVAINNLGIALRELGHELRRPEADFLRDGIYELRVRLQRINYRMLYFFHQDTAVVLSHGLVKERRVPPEEIDRTVEHRGKFEQDPEQHTHEEA